MHISHQLRNCMCPLLQCSSTSSSVGLLGLWIPRVSVGYIAGPHQGNIWAFFAALLERAGASWSLFSGRPWSTISPVCGLLGHSEAIWRHFWGLKIWFAIYAGKRHWERGSIVIEKWPTVICEGSWPWECRSIVFYKVSWPARTQHFLYEGSWFWERGPSIFARDSGPRSADS